MSATRPIERFVHDDEHRMLLDTIHGLSQERPVRAGDAGGGADERIDAARAELVRLGLWSLSLAEEQGGGGADAATVALATAAIGAAWPALGVALAHAHAAGAALAGDSAGRSVLAGVAAQGRGIAVVDLAGDSATSHDDGTIEVMRVDAAAPAPDLVVLVDDGTVALVPADRVEFGAPLARTGLDGAGSVPATTSLDRAAARFGADVRLVRRTLYQGLTAVAAGIAETAAHDAMAYAGERVQFGGPLTALPAVRDSLHTLLAGASDALTAAFAHPRDTTAAAALLDRTLEAAVDVASGAVQAHGGYGFLAEYPAEGRLRDAISLRAVADIGAVRERAAQAAAGPDDPGAVSRSA
ncbi:alkylation response protein AidB-like acyl-CoA dehydrogenase [Lipingzhangella halophila]|uniref:Alkylation response protein AidB-like acyl-CoA dehydrogenase n=1 Tax=Lipingzhangella halophila TaxID=1783352 RepID=A0A7W7RNJ2_9ACTN|nr:acyl-CoA dehydrogenase family protein [Lipingzhangella halophila]MBB4935300.1 alkylation response protein AidB-like acyl-CoA dehydrogenase [Lipingzhangella halophila]